jgi:predicted aspartyl protease
MQRHPGDNILFLSRYKDQAMLKKIFVLGFALATFMGGVLPPAALADGDYYIGRDARGVYFQTDRDGVWVVPKEDQHLFKIGEKGTYTQGKDSNGSFIQVGDKLKFYVNADTARRRPAAAGDTGAEAGTAASPRETRVTVKGNQVLVPVLIGHGGKEVQALLLLDTGASITTIDRRALKKLAVGRIEKTKLIVPGGKTVDADIVKLGYLKVGPHKLSNLHAAVIDHNGPAVAYQGLLGMNFLKEVDYRLDLKKQVIQWR